MKYDWAVGKPVQYVDVTDWYILALIGNPQRFATTVLNEGYFPEDTLIWDVRTLNPGMHGEMRTIRLLLTSAAFPIVGTDGEVPELRLTYKKIS